MAQKCHTMLACVHFINELALPFFKQMTGQNLSTRF